MKRFPLILMTGILASILITPFASSAFASLQSQTKTPELRVSKIEYPVGENCVVTVDSYAATKPPSLGQGKINPGFTSQDTVRGVLARVDESWIILQDGNYQNWIPRNKILMVRVGP